MASWVDYWNSDHPIYVNDRHKALHAAGIARDFARHIPSRDAAVLDYGCGEALYAEDVARLCGRLVLPTPLPRRPSERLAERVATLASVAVASPEDVERCPTAASTSSSPTPFSST